MKQGQLRVYLGAAPGVGKTFAMLSEGHRRADRGGDVVIAVADSHDRPRTAALLEGLEVVGSGRRLDAEAVLARAPEVALVDDLAAEDDGLPRWEAAERLTTSGIDVIGTVNVDELDSLREPVTRIVGEPPRRRLPDAVVRAAAQVELVDMTPEALRRRLAHGNVCPPERVDAAFAGYFRVGTLTALRELALLWMADKVDKALLSYRSEHAISEFWETRDRVVVCLSGGPEGDHLVRRGARLASRSGADLLAVHVTSSGELTGGDAALLAEQRALVEDLGGSYHQVVGDDVPGAILAFARAENATQLVIGLRRRSRLVTAWRRPGVLARLVRHSGPMEVHLVGHDRAGPSGRLPRAGGGLTARRRWQGALAAVLLLPLATGLLVSTRPHLNYASQMMTYLLAVVVVALIGGLWPALAAAVTGTLLLNWLFTPPFHTWSIGARSNALAIGVFFVVAAAMSSVVDLAARRTRAAARARAESETLGTLAASMLRGAAAIPALLDRARETFGMAAASLLEEQPDGSWSMLAAAGEEPPTSPQRAEVSVPAGTGLVLALRGRTLSADDRRVLAAFATQVAVALVQQRLAAEADAARPIVEADRMRAALLAAVSHDLRTPLAAAMAAVTSLATADVRWSGEERAELLDTAQLSLTRLTRLVDNLLDMSRLQAGALSVFCQPVGVDEVLAVVLDGFGASGSAVQVRLAAGVPEALADPALLERVVENLVANALRYSPAGRPPSIGVSAHAGRVEIRVVDRGPGVPAAARDQLFAPFQRLGDTDNTTGTGLGLALSRGLVEAMDGTLVDEDTPGGGLTMAVSLPAAPITSAAPGSREQRSPVSL